MTKTFNATFAAALIAASAFGASAAFAAGGDGEYFSGVSSQPAQSQSIDRTATHSIGNGASVAVNTDVGPANGDYFQGVSKDAR
jgi:hypothetical protein